jgi:hypothetical protein
MKHHRVGDARNMTNDDQNVASKASYLLDGPVDGMAPPDPTLGQRAQVALL